MTEKKENFVYFLKFLIVFAFAISVLSVGCTDVPENVLSPAESLLFSDYSSDKSTMIVVYMVGSNLESESGAGTYDLNSMVAGYPETESGHFNVIVGFGGANKTGWEGITVESINNLVSDSSDNIFGNGNSYEYRDISANMAEERTFENFLIYINKHYSDYDNKYLILWNHGSGYNGCCYDENFDDDGLTLPEIEEALYNSESSFDLIGFDACQMGMVEVASVLKPYSEYLVASEENEPESGWTYDGLFESLSENPRMSPAEFGKKIVDTYLTGEDNYRTLSLVDLKKTDELLSALDATGTQLNREIDSGRFEDIAGSYLYSQGFDYLPEEKCRKSVDILDLADNLQSNVFDVSDECDSLMDAVKSFVIYSGHDKSIDVAGGVAICSPRYIFAEDYYNISEYISLSENWDKFFENLILVKSLDNTNPEIKENGVNSYKVTDNLGVAEVYVCYNILKGDECVSICSKRIFPDDNGGYLVSGWDKRWYFLENGTGDILYPEMEFTGQTSDGLQRYYSSAYLTREGRKESVGLIITVDPDTHESDIKIELSDIDLDTGTSLSFWDLDELISGDIIEIIRSVYDEDGEILDEVNLGKIVVDDDTSLKYDDISDQICSYSIYAEDFNNNWDSMIKDIL